MILNDLITRASLRMGSKIERRDRLEESIPADYSHSRFLPRGYRGSVARYLYLLDQLQQLQGFAGAIVDCGVSTGHGALLFLLCSEYVGVERNYCGLDSFEGFPDSTVEDETTPIQGKEFYARPPATVLRVLRDGRIPGATI